MGFIVLPRLTLSGYIFSVENTRASLRPPFLTFLTYYYFLHARLINPPPRFYENVVINTPRMPVCFSLCRILPPSRLALREMPALNHFTLLSIRWGGGGRKKRGDERTFARATKRKKKGGKETRERKGKNVNEPAPVAPARTRTAECSLTAWRRDARRRQ